MSTSALSGSPFADYLLSGLVLFVVLGLGPILVTHGLRRRRAWAWPAAVAVAGAPFSRRPPNGTA